MVFMGSVDPLMHSFCLFDGGMNLVAGAAVALDCCASSDGLCCLLLPFVYDDDRMTWFIGFAHHDCWVWSLIANRL